MRRLKNNGGLRLTALEDRINMGVVSTTADFDPTTYNKVDISTWKPGYFRYEVIKAMEAGGGEVTFDETADLGGGAHFGGKIVDENTILLPYGEIRIKDIGLDNTHPHFTHVDIHAPKFFNQAKEYVKFQTTGTIVDPEDGDADEGSVFDIRIVKNPMRQIPNSPLGATILGR